MTDPAFLYTNGQLTNLGTLGGEYGQGRSINSSGQVAGYSTLASGAYRAFLYSGGQRWPSALLAPITASPTP